MQSNDGKHTPLKISLGELQELGIELPDAGLAEQTAPDAARSLARADKSAWEL